MLFHTKKGGGGLSFFLLGWMVSIETNMAAVKETPSTNKDYIIFVIACRLAMPIAVNNV